jgi:hypothetical protein
MPRTAAMKKPKALLNAAKFAAANPECRGSPRQFYAAIKPLMFNYYL